MMKYMFFSLALTVMVAFIIGCGGGDSATIPGSKLHVGADAQMPTRAAIALLAQLDSGATIEVFDLSTGSLITSGTIGADGYGNVTVTAGKAVAVVVTGNRGGKPYRLSTIIPIVPNEDADIVLTPATSIAAELLVKRFPNSLIDKGTFDKSVGDATEWLAENLSGQEMALSPDGVLQAGKFGVGAYDALKLAALVDKLPTTMTNNLVLAKNAVQQVKEAGMPLQGIMAAETPSLEKLNQKIIASFKTVNIDALQLKYSKLSTSLSDLILPATQGVFDLYDASGNSKQSSTIFDLTIGNGYRVELYNYGGLKLTEDSSLNVTGQITLVDVADKLVAKKSTGNWTLTQTSNVDSALEYKVVIPMDLVPSWELIHLGANPTVTGSFSIKDKSITTPIIFDGSVIATGANKESYTRIEFNGTLRGEGLNANCKMVANFPASLPAGAAPGSLTYEFPTDFALTNSNVTFTGGGLTASIAGDITAKASIIGDTGGYVSARPTELNFSNVMLSAAAGDSSVEITGNIKANVSYALDRGKQTPIFDSIDISGDISAKGGVQEVKLNGTFDATGVKKTVNGELTTVPNWVKVTGKYSNSDTKQDFDGLLEAKWNNPAITDYSLVDATVTVRATIHRDGYAVYAADMTFTGDGAGNFNGDIKNLGFGAFSLSGSTSGKLVTVAGNTELTGATLQLTNQSGVMLNLTEGTTGAITGLMTVNSIPVANIAKDVNTGKLVITFTDTTTELLPF